MEDGGLKSLKKNTIIDISEAALVYFEALKELRENFDPQGDEYDQEAYEVIDEALNDLREQATSKMGQDYGIDFYEYNEIIHEYSDALISTGSKAIEYLLENVNPQEEADKLEEEIRELSAQIAANP